MGRIIAIVLGVLLIIFIVFLGLRLRDSNRSLFGDGSSILTLSLNDVKPADWIPYQDDLIPVNIDHGDGGEAEWLFLYRYDGNTQIGGVIYDAQNRPRGSVSVPVSMQTPTYIVPYRLLPDYAQGKPFGYLGNDKVDWLELSTTGQTGEEGVANDRLVVRGFHRGLVNRYSIIWWLGEAEGYGVAHAHTPGWFTESAQVSDSSQAWNHWAAKSYVTTLWAWEPQNDRSNLCRRVKWELDEGDDPPYSRRFVGYYDGDITFCSGQTPNDPTFPEAQVLAYLHDNGDHRLRDDVKNDLKRQLEPFIDARVVRLSAPTDFSAPPTAPTPLAEVKVEFFDQNDMFHSMIWTLQVQVPTTVQERERWRIVSAVDIP